MFAIVGAFIVGYMVCGGFSTLILAVIEKKTQTDSIGIND